jgi:hypothetical protein
MNFILFMVACNEYVEDWNINGFTNNLSFQPSDINAKERVV